MTETVQMTDPRHGIPWSDDCDAFRKIQGTLVDYARWEPFVDGIEARVVDSAHAAMAVVKLYGAHLPGPAGIDLDWLKNAARSDPTRLWFDAELNRWTAEGLLEEWHAGVDLTATRWPELPRLSFGASARVPLSWCKKSLAACERISDHFELRLEAGHVTMTARSDEGRVTSTHHPQQAQGEGRSFYSCDYLHNLVDAIPACVVRLSWGNDYPVEIKWRRKNIAARFLMAPRVES